MQSLTIFRAKIKGFEVEDMPEDIKSEITDPENPFFDEDLTEELAQKEEKKYWKSVTDYKIKGIVFMDGNSVRYVSRKMLQNPDGFSEIAKILDKPTPPDAVTIYELDLKTGKKHQIRAHLSGVLNTPILFDTKYGFNLNNIQNDNVREFFKDYEEQILPDYFQSKYGPGDPTVEDKFPGKKLDLKIKRSSLGLETNWFLLHARSLGFEHKG